MRWFKVKDVIGGITYEMRDGLGSVIGTAYPTGSRLLTDKWVWRARTERGTSSSLYGAKAAAESSIVRQDRAAR